MEFRENTLHLKQLGIDTYKEAVIYMHEQCDVCRSEGFEVHARIRVQLGDKSILATVNTITNHLLEKNEASLSSYAWQLLGANEGDVVALFHPKPLQSLSSVRSKVYGNTLTQNKIQRIIEDIVHGSYSDIHIATFLTACAGGRLNKDEIIHLTHAMVNVGEKITWQREIVVDKHCVGGLPGNRTTLIIVPIIAAYGLTIPKTSSRAITSPAGTADTMEALAPVDLSLIEMHKVVEQENGCIVWGGGVGLSPADDILIGVERVMNLDSEGQLIASVLSKKMAAESNNIIIDMPVGPTAKVRSLEMAQALKLLFKNVSQSLGVNVKIIVTDAAEPVGRGIGPALEAHDVISVLQNNPDAPQDLRERALMLTATILEFADNVNDGYSIAKKLLDDGSAWKKFQAICDAQGGMREPNSAQFNHVVAAKERGRVTLIDNRQLARLAKLAGAPQDKTAGVYLHTPLDTLVEAGEPLMTIHADSRGELRYALSLLEQIPDIVQVEACE